VVHSLTANIGQFGFWRVSDEFNINVQGDSSDDESSSDLSSSMENALFISFFEGECFHVG
jgi:hypothetical protein